jgi:dipeptidyl aminopeptidase/acylaminoacyl peptidase
MNKNKFLLSLSLICVLFLFSQFSTKIWASEVLSPEDLLKIKRCSNVQVSPNGLWIAYTVSVPRKACEKPGSAYSELYLASTKTSIIKPFITGKVNIGSIRWKPDNSSVSFITRRGSNLKSQVWMIPVDGGEAVQLTGSKTGISNYEWHPGGKKIIYTATTPKTKKEKMLQEKGYGFIFYEENWKHRNLYIQNLEDNKVKQLTKDKTVWSFTINGDGGLIAFAASKRNLVDERYMFQKVYLLHLDSDKITQLTDNPGKLGNYSFSPDSSRMAYTAAIERKDHAVSQVYVINVSSKEKKNLTPANFRGHVNWAKWKDNKTILYHSGEGVVSTLSLVPVVGGKRKVIFSSEKTGVTFRTVSFTKDFKHFAFSGSNAYIPGDLFYWAPGKKVTQRTTLNPWLKKRRLGKQSVIRYQARDGVEIEGLLISPVNYQTGLKYPLVVTVHGGPESHYYNSWVSRYSSPGQVLAGKGYVIFFPNYRSSTGYGLKYALTGYEDAAGVEFDDIADGIEFLIKEGIADPTRIGLGGGSYGGYAAAWFSSYYTKYVRAVCMFVGISDLISKRGTTDIPYEELYVHSGRLLEKMWEDSLKRSPIYWAHQSKTAVLIIGGTNDTRVHPSQSLEYYRRLKMNNHPAVRLVQYPGEGHGNRRQPGRIDVLYRIIQWFDWYVKEKKAFDGPLPPLDISDKYGLDLPE